MDQIHIGGVYRHYKGGLYVVVTVATHTETREKLVIYQSSNGGIYARPYEMFLDGRFTLVEKPSTEE